MQRPAHALNPPVVAARFQHVPAIKRISPALTGRAERVGRNAGNDLRFQIRVQAKDVGMRPHVGAIEADEDGDIAHDLNAAARTLGVQSLPLFEEGELNGASDVEVGCMTFTREMLRVVIATGNFLGPLVPRLPAVFFAQYFEERVVLEPPCVIAAKAVEAARASRPRRS